eukprot:1185534-Prorocentrum_minimum.AAC.1
MFVRANRIAILDKFARSPDLLNSWYYMVWCGVVCVRQVADLTDCGHLGPLLAANCLCYPSIRHRFVSSYGLRYLDSLVPAAVACGYTALACITETVFCPTGAGSTLPAKVELRLSDGAYLITFNTTLAG